MIRYTVDLNTLMTTAASLLSESGENPEYDRAILELTSDLLGFPEEYRPDVIKGLRTRQAALLGR